MASRREWARSNHICASLLLVLLPAIFAFTSNGSVLVPGVLGLLEPQARARVEAEGLVLEVTGGPKGGVVVQQDPAKGTKVEPGTAIRVILGGT